MAIELPSSLRALDVSRPSRDNPRVVNPLKDKAQGPSASALPTIRQGGEEAFKKAETFRQQTQSQSSNSLKQQLAIETYQGVAKEQQRQDIQLLLGVDTFI